MKDSTLSRRDFLYAATAITASTCLPARAQTQPNIILIVADDLGYGDLGSYGQQTIATPNLDRMAAEGMRFTEFYAGSTVCTPSRGSLMTGLHTGHAPIRGNGLQFLRPSDTTMAEVLRDAGYTTAGYGKWGLGDSWTRGTPAQQGFDEWFGYLNHLQAHNYYPSHLFADKRPIPIPGNLRRFEDRTVYSHDIFAELALEYIAREHTRPYFLYLPFTIPHANTLGSWLGAEGMPIPDDAPYSDEPWPQTQRNHAAMITLLDRDIGRILDALDASGQSENTLIIFTSDNGPHEEGGADPEFFDSNGPLRGIKRDLYEGGIRVPMIARQPGTIAPGTTSNHVSAFWDLLPTFAEIAGTSSPTTDGISFLPTLNGATQPEHEYLYWQFNERGFKQAVRMGDWKGVRFERTGVFELYDLSSDIGETTNVADQFPDIVAMLTNAMDESQDEPDAGPIRIKPGGRRPLFEALMSAWPRS